MMLNAGRGLHYVRPVGGKTSLLGSGTEKISGEPMNRLFALAVPLLVVASAAQAVELKVLSGNGPRAAVRELCTQFERATGNKIDLRFGVNPRSRRRLKRAKVST